MANISIHAQLARLRRERGLTQEEIARTFGVTNQSVSKWESGACCPDIALLPDIADFFGVSVDELLGRTARDDLESVLAMVKRLFADTAETECFDTAYKIAFYLHEGAATRGYKGYLPWDTDKARVTDDDFYRWGTSICSEPEGVTVHKGNAILVSSQKRAREKESNEIMDIWCEIDRYADVDRLIVLFALYELTRRDFDLFVGADAIGEKCGFSVEKVREIFKHLPVQHKQLDNGGFGYRIEGSNMHVPTLLSLFAAAR
ncbi:MAG: helix-turn-helix domain-containing protein [Oscillospiraceae bacterium]|jgi:transcriptional regulator with XRE-family HTH domain|nr:helix-turn-helix domain-containing protein [Oscillospiraceae bacterium]